MEERAAKMVDDILADHHPELLPADIQAELKKIVTREQERVNARRLSIFEFITDVSTVAKSGVQGITERLMIYERI